MRWREDFFHTPISRAQAQRSGTAGCRRRGASLSCLINVSNSSPTKFCSVSSACAVRHSWTSWVLIPRCPGSVDGPLPALVTTDSVMKASSAIAAQRLSSGHWTSSLGLWTNGHKPRAEASLRSGRLAATGPAHGERPRPETVGGTARGPPRPRAPLYEYGFELSTTYYSSCST